MRSREVPTSMTVPASTASGSSVVSRMTRTGLPNDGASSFDPPEPVMEMSRDPRENQTAQKQADRSDGSADRLRAGVLRVLLRLDWDAPDKRSGRHSA